MAFVVTSVLTKGSVTDPAFDTWVSNIFDANILYEKFPDLAGTAPAQVINQQVADLVSVPAQGFIGDEVTVNDDGSVTTYVSTWESQADYEFSMTKGELKDYSLDATPGTITVSNVSTTVTGTNTYFTTNLVVGDTITIKTTVDPVDRDIFIGNVVNIESDTSLTLDNNSVATAENREYSKVFKETPLAFMQNLYNSTYSTTTETTFANV